VNTTPQLALSVQLPDDETFQSYQSQVNQPAVAQIINFVKQEFTDNSQKKILPCCYIFGLPGVGKSHLLHASCALVHDLGKSSVCLSFSELQHLSVEVFDGLEHIDLVCLDDIHQIENQPLWQQAVFDLYNRLSEQNHCLLVSGNKTVNTLSFSLADLTSRLSWGYVEQIKPLSDSEKLNAIIFRAQQRGLIVGDDVASYLMTRWSRDMKNLLAALDKLDKASIREQRRITIPFIKKVLF
jgi:DnaA family protein